MKKTILIVTIAALGLSIAGCNTNNPNDRAVGGALIGGASGAAIGALATGKAGGALAGGVLGAAGGAILGAATTPTQPEQPCPYGVVRGRDGRLYCR